MCACVCATLSPGDNRKASREPEEAKRSSEIQTKETGCTAIRDCGKLCSD